MAIKKIRHHKMLYQSSQKFVEIPLIGKQNHKILIATFFRTKKYIKIEASN